MENGFDDGYLLVKDFEDTFSRFRFPGFSSEGTCFLRVCVRQRTPVFLCVQLREYTGTSITNAAEAILQRAITMLVDKKVVVSKRKKSFRDYLSEEHFDKKKHNDLVRFFSERSVWIEHYPPDTGLSPGGSYAIVKFDLQLNPSWSYVRKETALRATGLQSSFFDVPDESLHYERD